MPNAADQADAPVVLLHGSPTCGALWSGLRAQVERRTFAPDLPGHGAEPPLPLGNHSVDDRLAGAVPAAPASALLARAPCCGHRLWRPAWRRARRPVWRSFLVCCLWGPGHWLGPSQDDCAARTASRLLPNVRGTPLDEPRSRACASPVVSRCRWGSTRGPRAREAHGGDGPRHLAAVHCTAPGPNPADPHPNAPGVGRGRRQLSPQASEAPQPGNGGSPGGRARRWPCVAL